MGCFLFTDAAATEIYTLSLHDALPICFDGMPVVVGLFGSSASDGMPSSAPLMRVKVTRPVRPFCCRSDRKSTRLNSSHVEISYAVFCLKKKTFRSTPPRLLRPPLGPWG